jgi:enoyl-CoA hydratase
MSQRLERFVEGGVCTLMLNRPDKLNALDTETFRALDAAVTTLENDEGNVGCVILRGAGRGFCAGADIKALSASLDMPAPDYKPGIVQRLGRLKQPTIAAVHGVCFTGGLELALACDFIVADETALFADTHGKWGLVGAWGMSQRLPRRIGVPAAKLMMMTGRTLPAVEAGRIGLVDVLAPCGRLDEVLGSLVAEVLANSWFTNIHVKKLLMDTDAMSLQEGLAHEYAHHPGHSPDHRKRIATFSRG